MQLIGARDVVIEDTDTDISFIGAKMLVMPWYHVPVQASLTVVAVLSTARCLASVLIAKKNDAA